MLRESLYDRQLTITDVMQEAGLRRAFFCGRLHNALLSAVAPFLCDTSQGQPACRMWFRHFLPGPTTGMARAAELDRGPLAGLADTQGTG